MRFTIITRSAQAVRDNPQRMAGFAFGLVIPLLLAGLVLVPKIGGLSDTNISSAPPAFIVPID